MNKNEQDQFLTRLRTELALGLEQAEQGKLLDLNLDEIEESALAELKTGNLSVKDSATYSANTGS